ncbi:hypothetical protein [Cysteiniphilum sp. QT6929]|uniref:hypothetical protein n=1 Tax=Cysteiniphilum sp. QT6929 TaxID=2975055 RepID=UPI0024B36B65|nr:hypothetical protein [Cysteiniphilum sp. QT6929]WHN66799.1 hypothetical protein NYP54_11650 [Cysteiniphilum sp. QT6929]
MTVSFLIFLIALLVIMTVLLCFKPSVESFVWVFKQSNKKRALLLHVSRLITAFMMYYVVVYIMTMFAIMGSAMLLMAYQKLLGLDTINYDYDGFLALVECIALMVSVILTLLNVRRVEYLANRMADKKTKPISLFSLYQQGGND